MSIDEGSHSLACAKCRTHRVRCDRVRPTCSRCSRLHHSCTYPERNPATAYVKYVRELESKVAALEQQLVEAGINHNHNQYSDSVAAQWDNDNDSGRTAAATTTPTTPGDHHLIDDLFAQAQATSSSFSSTSSSSPPSPSSPSSTTAGAQQNTKVKTLVDGLAQVSLAAMTPHGIVARAQDSLLPSLILAASLPPTTPSQSQDQSGINQLQPLPYLELPRLQIAERVCARYCDDILPAFPCLTAPEVHHHCQNAYKAISNSSSSSSAYSSFVTAAILATTAVVISPGSTHKAASLYFYGLSRLESAFSQVQAGDEEQAVKSSDDALTDLEAVLLLGYFGSLAGDAYSDAWALSGLAIRIAVDLGLHKAADTDRKRRLFWAAYILDRRCAVTTRRPPGLPDEAIANNASPSTTSLLHHHQPAVELYRIISAAYRDCVLLGSGLALHRRHEYSRSIDAWEKRYRLETTTASLPQILSKDIALIRDLINVERH